MSSSTYNAHLHAAIAQQDLDWAEVALHFGADSNCIDEEGNTPLHLLVVHGGERIHDFMRLLMTAGAKVDIKNKNGVTAVEMAQDNEKWELALELASFTLINSAAR